MQQSELQQDYLFEFAGMPQSGKSTIEDIVAHYLKRQGFIIEEYRGGSRYSPLRFSSIADLNVLLACRAVEFVISTSGREKEVHKIFLLDRGLIDRYIFTNVLLRQGKIDDDTAAATKTFLTSSRLLKRMDGVFIFATTPELAIMRENENKLVKSVGGVMNPAFLSDMRSVIEDDIKLVRSLLKNVHVELIDTSKENGKVEDTAGSVADTISGIIRGTSRIRT